MDEESDGFLRFKASAVLGSISTLIASLGNFSGEPYEVYLNILLESYIKGFIVNFPNSIVTNIIKIDHQKLIDRSAYIRKENLPEVVIRIDDSYQKSFRTDVIRRTMSEGNDYPMKITITALFLIMGYNKLKSIWE